MRRLFENGWDIVLRFLGACTALGGMGNMKVLWILMALDYGTGLLLALLHKSRKSTDGGFDWKVFLMGLGQKGMMNALVYLAGALDDISGSNGMLQNAAIGFYIVQEGISLAGNAIGFGVPVPLGIRNALNTLKEKEHAAT